MSFDYAVHFSTWVCILNGPAVTYWTTCFKSLEKLSVFRGLINLLQSHVFKIKSGTAADSKDNHFNPVSLVLNKNKCFLLPLSRV